MTSPDSMQRLIDQGMASRTVGSTAMNDTSSRSHSVFTVKVSGGNGSRVTRGIHGSTNNHDDNNPSSNWHNVVVLVDQFGGGDVVGALSKTFHRRWVLNTLSGFIKGVQARGENA